MQKQKLTVLVAALFGAAYVAAQPKSATSLGSPLATVKLTKTEIISEKSYKDNLVKLEKGLGRPLTQEERTAFFNSLINDILFFQMCERDGVRVSEGEVDASIAQLRAQQRPGGETDQQFSAFLASQGASYDELRTEYRKQILVQRWLSSAKAAEISAIPPVTSSEILSTYDLYKTKLIRPDSVRISFLYYQCEQNDAAARAKGAGVMKDLAAKLNKGESFDTLRMKAAENGYASNRDPVYFEKTDVFLTQFGKKFYDTVFSMKDGANSIPFETEVGWWIVRRIEFIPQRQLELSDPYRLGQPGTVQDYIMQLLTQQRQAEFMQRVFDDLFKKLRTQSEIKILGTP